MSRIDDLIEELCPEGVPYRPLGEILDYEQPGNYLVKSTNYDDSYGTPVLTAGNTFVLGYTDESVGCFEASKDDPVIIFDDFTTNFKWVDFSFKAKSSAMKMLRLRDSDEYSIRFVYYAMSCLSYRPQDHARQWIGIYSQFKIPAPPIEIQREIVIILDKFTRLEAELEAELEHRRLQFSYYLNTLIESIDASRTALGQIGNIIRGRRFVKADYVEDGIPAIHYGEIYTHFSTEAHSSLNSVNPGIEGRLRFAEPGSVIFAGVGETADDVGKPVAWLGSHRVAFHDDTFCFVSDMNPSYVAYAAQTDRFIAEKANFVAAGKVKRLSCAGLSQLTIPMPDRSTQDQIVEDLNRFNALVNDLSIGLPAEIAARRKQYEYYRDKLLTFKELQS